MFPNIDAGATYIDSDTGLESMSSAEATTKACSLCLDGGGNNVGVHAQGMSAGMPSSEAGMQIDGLRHEVTRLKCDKLDLLRQNVVSGKFVTVVRFVVQTISISFDKIRGLNARKRCTILDNLSLKMLRTGRTATAYYVNSNF